MEVWPGRGGEQGCMERLRRKPEKKFQRKSVQSKKDQGSLKETVGVVRNAKISVSESCMMEKTPSSPLR